MDIPNFDKALDGLCQVNFKGGAVGKIAYATCFIDLLLACICLFSSSETIKLIALSAILLFSGIMFILLIRFADRHPNAALLEGSQIIERERIIQASKNNTQVLSRVRSGDPLIDNESEAALLAVVDAKSEGEESLDG